MGSEQFSEDSAHRMVNDKVSGLKQVAFYVLCSVLCLVLNKEAAQNIGKNKKRFHLRTSMPNFGTRQRVKAIPNIFSGSRVSFSMFAQ